MTTRDRILNCPVLLGAAYDMLGVDAGNVRRHLALDAGMQQRHKAVDFDVTPQLP